MLTKLEDEKTELGRIINIVQDEIVTIRRNFTDPMSYAESTARYINSFRWKTERLLEAQIYFTSQVLDKSNGTKLNNIYNDIITKF